MQNIIIIQCYNGVCPKSNVFVLICRLSVTTDRASKTD